MRLTRAIKPNIFQYLKIKFSNTQFLSPDRFRTVTVRRYSSEEKDKEFEQ